MDLSIFIVSYNTKELTKTCIASILEQTSACEYEILVWDNASADGSAQYLQETFPEITVIASEDNLGFAKANNKLSQMAKGSYYLIINPDTIVKNKAIETLYNYALNDTKQGMYGGKSLNQHEELDPEGAWNAPTVLSNWLLALGLSQVFSNSKFFNPEKIFNWNRADPFQVDIITGCYILMSKINWDKLNGFSEDFFMYGEDADLSLRAHQLGIDRVINPESTIIHYGGASESVKSGKMIRLFNGRSILFAKHFSPSRAFWAIKAFDIWALIRCSAFFCLSLLAKKFKVKHQTWLEIWRGRSKWNSHTSKN